MSNMVTRCPQCQTSFKVTEEHLKIANGAVRCGSCLLVFQARQHWVNPDNMAAPSGATPAAGSKFQFDQSAVTANPSAGAKQKPAEKAFVLPSSPVAEPDVPHHKKLEEIGDDDKISDDLDIEDDEPVIAPKQSAKPSQFGDPEDDYGSVFDEFDEHAVAEQFGEALDEGFIDVDALADDEIAPSSGEETSDDAWAKAMLDEMERDEKPEDIDLSKVDNVRDILTDFTNPVDVDAARRDLGFDRHDPFAASEVGDRKTVGDGRAEMIAHIEPLPVELSAGKAQQTADWKSILLWNGSALVLTMLLLVQYVGFNFNQLAKSVTARPYMQTLCGVIGCQLPPVEIWRYIKIQNLVVRTHPEAANGLAVDAILLNVTERDLPFPQLELFFSDLTQTPVASRRFEPAEYLSGELSGQTVIPPGRPVHIAFDIVNPGPKAVNRILQVAGKLD